MSDTETEAGLQRNTIDQKSAKTLRRFLWAGAAAVVGVCTVMVWGDAVQATDKIDHERAGIEATNQLRSRQFEGFLKGFVRSDLPAQVRVVNLPHDSFDSTVNAHIGVTFGKCYAQFEIDPDVRGRTSIYDSNDQDPLAVMHGGVQVEERLPTELSLLESMSPSCAITPAEHSVVEKPR